MHFILTDSAVTDDIKLDQRRPLHICNFLQDFLRRFRSLGEQDHYDPPQLSFSHNNNDDEKYIEKKRESEWVIQIFIAEPYIFQ